MLSILGVGILGDLERVERAWELDLVARLICWRGSVIS
jgi:hypothetical protein